MRAGVLMCVIAAKSQKLQNHRPVSTRPAPNQWKSRTGTRLLGNKSTLISSRRHLFISPLAVMWASASSFSRERETGDSDAVEEFSNEVKEDAGGVRAALDFRLAQRWRLWNWRFSLSSLFVSLDCCTEKHIYLFFVFVFLATHIVCL